VKKKRLADGGIRVDRIGLLDLLQWLAMPLEGLASGQRVSRGHSFDCLLTGLCCVGLLLVCVTCRERISSK